MRCGGGSDSAAMRSTVQGEGCIRERPREVENSGGWKTYRKFGEKPLPKNVFGPPPPTIRFPPPFFGDSL